jgi:hypothetical protein
MDNMDNEIMGNRIICGGALETLRTLPPQIVNCCVTSPPFVRADSAKSRRRLRGGRRLARSVARPLRRNPVACVGRDWALRRYRARRGTGIDKPKSNRPVRRRYKIAVQPRLTQAASAILRGRTAKRARNRSVSVRDDSET